MEIYLPIAESPINILLILGMGVAVGFISGLFGVGGGFLMTPLLIFVGIPPAIAVATVSTQIAASSMTGVISYWRRRAVDVKLGTVLVAAGLIGTAGGVWFFNAMRRLGQLDLVIVVSYVLLFGIIGSLMLRESIKTIWARRRAKGAPPPARPRGHPWFFGLPWRMRFHRSKIYASVIPISLVALIISFLGAVLGIGGGFILVPALIYLFHVPTAVVVGTSLFQILFTMLAATVLHSVTNQVVDVVLGLVLIIGGVIGAQFGTRAGQNLKGDTFRLLLAVLVLAVGVRFAIDLVVKPSDPFSLFIVDRGR